jgi:hypothetical protein
MLLATSALSRNNAVSMEQTEQGQQIVHERYRNIELSSLPEPPLISSLLAYPTIWEREILSRWEGGRGLIFAPLHWLLQRSNLSRVVSPVENH